MPIHVGEANFEQEVLNSPQPVLVDFWAQWCPPCRMLEPIFEEVAKQYGDKVKFAKLNVDEHPRIAQQYGVTGIPTLILFWQGREIDRVIGFLPKQDLQNFIDAALSKI